MKEGYLFVILDPIVDCVPIINANDYAQVNTALKPLRSLAIKYGAHILCVHHANRQGTGANAFLGSQAFRGFSDTNLWLDGTEQEPRFLSSENRISSRHGGWSFEKVNLVERQDDGSVVVGIQLL
jgi:RecA-family ATPase